MAQVNILKIEFHILIQGFLISLQGKQIIGPGGDNLSAILYRQPIASIVTIQPFKGCHFQ
jgi:hypothetical protein